MQNNSFVKKWGPILENDSFPKIEDGHKKAVTAVILENTVSAIKEDPSRMSSMTMLTETTNVAGTGGFGGSATATGPSAGYDPVLINLVRRSMPNLMAYDIAGVQAMTAPTGLIFAMRSKYAVDPANTATWVESGFNEADTDYSGTGTMAGTTGSAATANTGTGIATGAAEAYGVSGGTAFAEMAISIEKVAVEAKSRMLKAEYTTELAQDLRAVHGLDAESELANILAGEILAEINRELVRTIYTTAVTGANTGTQTQGIFDLDVDANGRWSEEKFKGLMFQVEREANAIAKGTRRGKGNIIVCSSDVASALYTSRMLDHTKVYDSNAIDDTGNTFAGVLNNRYKVYIDPYAGADYMVVGYKGKSSFDAGVFYCPYVPLMMARAVGENTFQPKIGFKTRYGLVANPFAQGITQGSGALTANTNQYYRRVRVTNLM